ncbi:MAG TPA: carboxypeptidase regulatory-like domain-containing protein [Planctomycetota bacterium]|nr:carboxypeptidase regulatory-like domain-containing protein [Planctomycetota bacterium]
MRRLAPFVVGLALGGILGFLVGQSGPEAALPRTSTRRHVDDDRADRIALLTEELSRARSENDELRAAEAKDRAPARAEPTPTAEPPASATTGALRVKTTDAAGGPLAKARVTLHRRDPKSNEEKQVETDALGITLFPNLTPAKWKVFVYKAGQSWDTETDVRAGETTEIVVAFVKGTAAIEGTVRSSDGKPLAEAYMGATILVDGSSWRFDTNTDKEGHYRLQELPAGKCLVSAGVKVEGGTKTLMEWIQLADGAVVQKDFQEGAVSLFGSVRDASTGRPIPDVSVSAQSPMYSNTKTDERGQWQFLDLMPGDYTIVVSKDGYGIVFLSKIEVGGAGRELDLDLLPAVELALTVTGPDGCPYEGRLFMSFKPVVEGEGTRVGTSTTTDAKGQAVYRQALPGDYDLVFRADGVGAATLRGAKLSQGMEPLRVELR